MSIARWVYPVICFVSGLGVGVLWSPIERPHTTDSRVLSDEQSENKKLVAQLIEMGGEETAEFAKQFEDMTTRTNKYPLQACASPDGRFVIRLLGSDETIASEMASDLLYPDSGGVVNEVVRRYSFSCDGRTYSCDFGRSIVDSKMIAVLFCFTDAKGRDLSYVDSDADGRWDRFTDRSQEPHKVYERDGLCWKERAEDTPSGGDEDN